MQDPDFSFTTYTSPVHPYLAFQGENRFDNSENFIKHLQHNRVGKMAVNRIISSPTITKKKYHCEKCLLTLEADDRKLFSKNNVDRIHTLCIECYDLVNKVKVFSFSFIGLVLTSVLVWGVMTYFKLRPDRF